MRMNISSVLILSAASLAAVPASADSVRTYFTDARIRAMRDNIANHDWARAQRDQQAERQHGRRPQAQRVLVAGRRRLEHHPFDDAQHVHRAVLAQLDGLTEHGHRDRRAGFARDHAGTVPRPA